MTKEEKLKQREEFCQTDGFVHLEFVAEYMGVEIYRYKFGKPVYYCIAPVDRSLLYHSDGDVRSCYDVDFVSIRAAKRYIKQWLG